MSLEAKESKDSGTELCKQLDLLETSKNKNFHRRTRNLWRNLGTTIGCAPSS